MEKTFATLRQGHNGAAMQAWLSAASQVEVEELRTSF